jgi:putative ABC transport system ATP-binding protein
MRSAQSELILSGNAMHPVSLHQVGKTYRLGAVDVPALSDITLDIHQGAFTVLSGPRAAARPPCST